MTDERSLPTQAVDRVRGGRSRLPAVVVGAVLIVVAGAGLKGRFDTPPRAPAEAPALAAEAPATPAPVAVADATPARGDPTTDGRAVAPLAGEPGVGRCLPPERKLRARITNVYEPLAWLTIASGERCEVRKLARVGGIWHAALPVPGGRKTEATVSLIARTAAGPTVFEPIALRAGDRRDGTRSREIARGTQTLGDDRSGALAWSYRITVERRPAASPVVRVILEPASPTRTSRDAR